MSKPFDLLKSPLATCAGSCEVADPPGKVDAGLEP